MRIRMLHSVMADDPWITSKPGVLEQGREYEAKCSPTGQISALSEPPRDRIVVKPGEFELILDGDEWENLVKVIRGPMVYSVGLAIKGAVE